jgi:pyruvate dehydrogenase E2 component (dihydrolipoamide acetyltransferase)
MMKGRNYFEEVLQHRRGRRHQRRIDGAGVKDVRTKNIFQLAQELADLYEKARSRTIDLADLKGGTFTLTKFGAMGGIYGFPIIHHPEVAILGLGKIMEKPLVVVGKIEIRKVLPLSLSFDHRVVDGAEAVRFMNTVIELLEDPATSHGKNENIRGI